MVGHIYIYGDIGNTGLDDGQGFVELQDVMAQVSKYQRKGEISEWLVHVKSPGGIVPVGDDIYNYLDDLKKGGTRVNTITDGDVASIATKIFLVGQNRTIVGNHEFFIHNPWIDGVTGEAKDFESTGAELRGIEKEMAKFYSKVTGHTENGILSLMKEGTGIRGQMAVDMGFATHHAQAVQAKVFAMMKPVESTKDKDKKSKKAKKMSKYKSLMKEVKNLIKSLNSEDVMNIDITLQDGATIRVVDAETEEMAVGKAAVLIDAEGNESPAPSGEHVMSDGRTVVVDEGNMIASISAPESEVDALKAKIKELENKLNAKESKESVVSEEELTELLSQMKKVTKEAKKEKKEFMALQEKMRQIQTEYKIPENKIFNKGEERSIEGITKDALKERLEKRKEKAKTGLSTVN